MPEPKDPVALTEDGRAPVLSEDQAEAPPETKGGGQNEEKRATEDRDEGKAIDLPVEEGDFDAQPG